MPVEAAAEAVAAVARADLLRNQGSPTNQASSRRLERRVRSIRVTVAQRAHDNQNGATTRFVRFYAELVRGAPSRCEILPQSPFLSSAEGRYLCGSGFSTQ
jgi:hypothetical protein